MKNTATAPIITDDSQLITEFKFANVRDIHSKEMTIELFFRFHTPARYCRVLCRDAGGDIWQAVVIRSAQNSLERYQTPVVTVPTVSYSNSYDAIALIAAIEYAALVAQSMLDTSGIKDAHKAQAIITRQSLKWIG